MMRFPAKKGYLGILLPRHPLFSQNSLSQEPPPTVFQPLRIHMLLDFLTHGAVWSLATKVQTSGHVPIIKNT